MQHLYAFSYGFSVDLLFALFYFFSSRKQKLPAVLVGQLLALVNILGYIEIGSNRSLLPAYIIGVGCGIYLGMFLSEKILK